MRITPQPGQSVRGTLGNLAVTVHRREDGLFNVAARTVRKGALLLSRDGVSEPHVPLVIREACQIEGITNPKLLEWELVA